ncbi:hypothetical protein [Halomonas sp. JS92-SW72]|uniref:phage tail terminator protein n=1 Tax=Halomonas sp. JS92-SW72 TaxID=2306583 RepID=UPI000E5B88B7|nr:hypothetical protein [Halomonas sp. JS92-SW72]AXY41600.1 hypothetical protein D1793_04970 [Halomonas sp. JS92-SW72]
MSQALHHADYLVAGGRIIQRLEDLLEDLEELKVLSAADLAEVAEQAQHTPAVFVLYAGDVVPGGAATDQGDYHVLRQRWLVVLAVRSPRKQMGGQSVRDAAGPILSRTLQALSGWRPGPGFGPLVRVNAPAPAYRRGGYGYFPLQFEAVLATQAASVD